MMLFVARHIDPTGGQWSQVCTSRAAAVQALEARVGLTVAGDWWPRGPRGRDLAPVCGHTLIVDPVGREPYRGLVYGGL